jgi:hypothetical protein
VPEGLEEPEVLARAPAQVQVAVPEAQQVAAVPVMEVPAVQAEVPVEVLVGEAPRPQHQAQRAALPTYARRLTIKP